MYGSKMKTNQDMDSEYSPTTDLQREKEQTEEFRESIDGLIKGKYNILTTEEDFHSQVVVASELMCRG